MNSRAGMPYTGIATFGRAPYVQLPEGASALLEQPPHFAVYGFPFDCAVGYRSGQRMAPRAIRDMSTRFAMNWGPENTGYWDIETGEWFLQGASLIDGGDVDPLYFDTGHLDASAAALVGAAVAMGTVPIGLGGDHSVTFPMIQALAPLFGPRGRFAGRKLHIVQLDAHLDFTDSVGGFKRSNSSPIRRSSELGYLGGVTCIGLRGLRTNPEAYHASLERGHTLVLMKQIREEGLAAALDALPSDELVYITFDIDVLDPAVAPGTSSPEVDGMTYADVRAIIRQTAARNQVIAADVVEVNPYMDVGHLTSLIAARSAVEMMAYIYAAGASVSA
jgi:agmatinase